MAQTQTVITLSPEELRQLVREELKAAAAGKPAAAEPAQYVDAAAVCKRFSIDRSTLQRWIKSKGCPHRLNGRILRFDLQAVEAWFAGRERELKRVK